MTPIPQLLTSGVNRMSHSTTECIMSKPGTCITILPTMLVDLGEVRCHVSSRGLVASLLSKSTPPDGILFSN